MPKKKTSEPAKESSSLTPGRKKESKKPSEKTQKRSKSTAPSNIRDKSSSQSKAHTKFNEEIFEQHAHFRTYFIQDPKDQYRFVCKACQSKNFDKYSGFYDNMRDHLATNQHKLAIPEEVHNDIHVARHAYLSFRNQRRKKLVIASKDSLTKMKIEYVAFMIKHGLPYSIAPNLITISKHMLEVYGPECVSQLTMSDKTASQIAKSCIAKSFKEEIYRDIAERPFSLLFDESASKFGPTYLCTFVRYLKDNKFHDRLLALNEIKEGMTGLDLFNMIHQEVFPAEREILLHKNLIGVCSDRASNMSSEVDKGLTNRFVDKYKHLIKCPDLSHSFNLVCKYAILKLPSHLIKLIKKISCHFARSALRRSKLKECQSNISESDFNDFKQILSYTPTRWTSLFKSAERIILLWQALEVYYDRYKDNFIPAEMTQENYIYLELLVCLVGKLNTHIKMFEASDLEYSSILPKIRTAFSMLAQMIVQEKYIYKTSKFAKFTSLYKLPYHNPNQLEESLVDIKDFEKLFLETYAKLGFRLSVMSEKFKKECIKSAREFIIETLIKMKEYLPFENQILIHCELLNFEATGIEKWVLMGKKFENQIKPNSFYEFHEQATLFYENYEEIKSKFTRSDSLIQFWQSLSKDYCILSRIALSLLVLTYSTVPIERSFLILRDICEPKRNRLSPESVEAILLVHQSLLDMGNFTIDPDILLKYSNMWDNKSPTKKKNQRELGNSNLIQEIVDQKEELLNANHSQEPESDDNLFKDIEPLSPKDITAKVHEDYISTEETKKRKTSRHLNRENYDQTLKNGKLNEKKEDPLTSQ